MTANETYFSRLMVALSGSALIACSAMAGTPSVTVVFTEIAGHPTSAAPGMLDLTGTPVAAKIDALFDFALSPDASQWIIRIDTDLPTTHDQALLLGSSSGYSVIAQDGQPVQGGAAGELWDFFDSDYPGSFDEAGNFAFSGRAKNGVAAVKEKLVKVINGVHTIILTESTPVSNILDVPANPQDDELVGNSVGSVSLRNDGGIFFGNTPLQNCHSTRYPALFIDTVGFAQSGVTQIGFETWDDFGFGDCGMAPDGNNWYAIGDTENPDLNSDKIFAVNNIKIAQENTALGATGITVGSSAPFFFCRMNANGDWFLRGDDTADNDWAITGNGDTWTLIAKTGDPITTPLQGPTENWGAVFTAFHGNSKGDWVLTGNTNNPNLATDDVLVLNGTEVILREGDPVDLDGNGQFDDDLFIGNNPTSATLRAFHANDLLITDDQLIHAFVTVRNGAGAVLGDAYLQIDLNPAGPVCPADINGDNQVGVSDLLAVIGAWGPCGGTCPPACTGDINGDCSVGVSDLLTVISSWGPCQ